jgi:AcrR family transcriptional regulator
MTTRGPGRRPGETRTREAILAAARERFARDGYDRTTIRAVAADAGVDPALVMHFFPAKERLFTAVIDLPEDVERAIDQALHGDPGDLGERLMRMFVDVWEDPVSGPRMIGLLRSAASYDAAAARLRDVFDTRILRRFGEVSQDRLRADLVSAQLVGVAMLRYVLRIEPLASADRETLIAAVAPTLQRYFTGDFAGVKHPRRT